MYECICVYVHIQLLFDSLRMQKLIACIIVPQVRVRVRAKVRPRAKVRARATVRVRVRVR